MSKNLVFITLGASTILSLGIAQPAHSRFYAQHNLVSDGALPADHVDPQLVNAWGLVSSSTSPWWVSDNGNGLSTLYNGAGVKQSLTVTVSGSPTGIVFNGETGFVVSSGSFRHAHGGRASGS